MGTLFWMALVITIILMFIFVVIIYYFEPIKKVTAIFESGICGLMILGTAMLYVVVALVIDAYFSLMATIISAIALVLLLFSVGKALNYILPKETYINSADKNFCVLVSFVGTAIIGGYFSFKFSDANYLLIPSISLGIVVGLFIPLDALLLADKMSFKKVISQFQGIHICTIITVLVEVSAILFLRQLLGEKRMEEMYHGIGCGEGISLVMIFGTYFAIHKINQINMVKHYDKLIDEENDPVNDTDEMKEYMNKWDGEKFLKLMKLSKKKNVLEIGVGTGRLAIRVAPLCNHFDGIDISKKTIQRARKNLREISNITLYEEDFQKYKFDKKYDIIYATLTFSHIKNKQKAIRKVKELLTEEGRFVLSICKNQKNYFRVNDRKINVYPDNKDEIKRYFVDCGLEVEEEFSTEKADIIVGIKRNYF